MNYRYMLSCLILGLVSYKSYGQSSNDLSLPVLWEQALSSYPGIKASRAQLKTSKLNQKLIRNQRLPQVQLQVQNTIGTQQSAGGAFFPLPGIYNIGGPAAGDVSGPAASMYGSMVMDWKFLQFGKQKKKEEAAEILSRQAMHRLSAEQLAVQVGVSRTYFDLLYHRHMERWALENTDRLETLFAVAKSLAEAGLAPGADSLLVKATLKQVASSLENWRGRQEESALSLSAWVDIPATQLLIRSESFLTQGSRMAVEPSTDQLTHPLMAFRREQLAYADKLNELASLRILPDLSLLGGMQIRGKAAAQQDPFYESWQNSYSNPVHNYLLGIGMTWNTDKLFNYKTEKSLSREAMIFREAEAEETALNLKSRQQMTHQRIIRGQHQIENAEEAYTAAREAYRLFEARYNSGLIPVNDLLQIQDVLQKTEKTRIEAYYQYWIQQVEFAESTADFSVLYDVFK